MNPSPDRLFDLLPPVYRQRDAEQGYPLRALLQVISEQVNLLEGDIAQLYENWFIETCQDWVVPYIGDLIGYQPLYEAGEPLDLTSPQGRLLSRFLNSRSAVANTLAHRQRKGTLHVLELLSRDVAGWPARAVEFFRLLSWTQHLNFQQHSIGRTADMRQGDALDRLNGAFDEIAHTEDVRRISTPYTPQGRYHLLNVGLFVWRLRSYSVTRSQAYCLESVGPQCYTFSALANDLQLFTRPEEESLSETLAGPLNVPDPIRRRAFERRWKTIDGETHIEASPDYYGLDSDGSARSLVIWAPDWPTRGENTTAPIPASRILPANLQDWKYRPRKGTIAVDPVLGRIVFPPGQLPKKGVRVSYHYGFSADMGGGEYHRQLSQPEGAIIFPVDDSESRRSKLDPLAEALQKWKTESDAHRDQPYHAVIELPDSEVYVPKLSRIELPPGHTLQIRAADRARPVLRLLDYQTEGPDMLTVALAPGSRFTLDGLWISGRGVYVEPWQPEPEENPADDQPADQNQSAQQAQIGQDQEPPPEPEPDPAKECCGEDQPPTLPPPRLIIRHCTLVPGWLLDSDCEPRRPAEPSLVIFNVFVKVHVESTILGSILVYEDRVQTDPIPIHLVNTILDATGRGCAGPECEALSASDSGFAHSVLTIDRCTVIGKILTHAIELGENTLFTDLVTVARRQIGCLRFSYVPPGSRTPRRYNCQPDLVVRAVSERVAQGELPAAQESLEADRERLRVRPLFNSLRYGRPAYCQLSHACAEEITTGAEDGSEMGAFHDLFQPQRLANLRQRLDEFTPAGMSSGVIFVT